MEAIDSVKVFLGLQHCQALNSSGSATKPETGIFARDERTRYSWYIEPDLFRINVSWNKPFWSTFAPSYPYGKYYISDHLCSRLCSLKCCLLVLAVPKDCLEGALNRTLQSLSVLYPVSSCKWKGSCAIRGPRHPFLHFFQEPMDNLLHISFCPVICCAVGYFANQRYFEIKQNNIHLTLPLVCLAPWIPRAAPFPSICAKRPPRCIEFPENGLNSVMILGCRKCGNLNLKLWDVKEWSISLIASENKGSTWSYLFNQDSPQ